MSRIQTLGALGEEAASAYLAGKGYDILSRNWRCGHLEIDIICQYDSEIVFVEVKTRRDGYRTDPSSAITPKKMRNLSRAAQAWLSLLESWPPPCRFDVVCVSGRPGSFYLRHYLNAFPYVPSLDSFNSDRQY